jgi:hypothetical protein
MIVAREEGIFCKAAMGDSGCGFRLPTLET